jgi:hypothetical protein
MRDVPDAATLDRFVFFRIETCRLPAKIYRELSYFTGDGAY